MNVHNNHIIARYNIKLLLRNKLLYSVFEIKYGVLLYVLVREQSFLLSPSQSSFKHLPSFIPYMNVFLFSTFQTLPLIVLACRFLYKNKNIDTLEAIYYRPESNKEYVWGIFLAFVYTFGGAAIISLVIAMLIHLFATTAPFDITIYLFYLSSMILPSSVFLIGLTFFLVNQLRNQVFSLIILLGYIAATIVYIRDFQQSLLDPLGITLPNTFSDFTGHPDLKSYLMQRGCWFFLGLGLIQLTVINFNRIPNHSGKKGNTIVMILFMALGVLCGGAYFLSNQKVYSLRRTYSTIYDKYEFAGKATLLSQDIKYEQKGDRMIVNSELLVQNQTNNELERIIFYLNPRLDLISLTKADADIPFKREHQVILVQQSLASRDSLRIHMRYEGKIDENICYLDVPNKMLASFDQRMYQACRFGKNHAYLRENFTLLIPEVLWYPTTVPPISLQQKHNLPKNFARYSLQVSSQGNHKVISQGKSRVLDKKIIFKNEHPLPGLTLCIGDYSSHQIVLDSITYELNILKKHEYLLKALTNVQDLSIPEMIRKLRYRAESGTGRSYPYDRFVLTEIPINQDSYFRIERGGSEFVQPELVFFPECGINTPIYLPVKSAYRINENLQDFLLKEECPYYSFSWENILGIYRLGLSYYKGDHERSNNKHQTSALFLDQTTHIYSKEYPFINSLINLIVQDNNPTSKGGRRTITPEIERQAIDYLTTKSIQEAMHDKTLHPTVLNTIWTLKSRELVDQFDFEGIPRDSLVAFINTFLTRHQFKEVDFYRFEKEFETKFCIGWGHVLPTWYTRNQIPKYLVKYEPIARVNRNKNKYIGRLEFSIFNDSKVDGIINIQINTELPGGVEARRVASAEGRREFVFNYRSYKIEAGTGKHFAFLTNDVRTVDLNTNISQNMPNKLSLNATGFFTPDTSQFTRTVTKDYFLPDSNEIIVDNEDEGFRIMQSISRIKSSDTSTPTGKWKTHVTQDGYGLSTRSYLYKKATSDTYSLAWSAQLPKKGRYEALVYIPRNRLFVILSGPQKYKILPRGGEEEIVVTDNIQRQHGWISLGYFDCLPGESKIYLSDDGNDNQVIFGDAIKWVYIE